MLRRREHCTGGGRRTPCSLSITFIPTGKTSEAILTAIGGSAVLKGSETQVDEVPTYGGQRAPWAVLGYTQEVATLFKKEQAEFVSGVEQRRGEWQGKNRQERTLDGGCPVLAQPSRTHPRARAGSPSRPNK